MDPGFSNREQHDPPLSTGAVSHLVFSEIGSRTPDRADMILNLAVFISRQPRFEAIPAEDRQALIDNIVLRISDGVERGRVFTVAKAALEQGDRIVAYLCSKSTGEFRADTLYTLLEAAEIGFPVGKIFQHFVKPELPSFQLNPSPVMNWNLEGSLRYLFSHYEADRDRPGSVGILMLAEVDRSVRRLGYSGALLAKVLQRYRQEDAHYVVTFARCAQLAAWEPDRNAATARLQEYVNIRDEKGLHPDYGIRFHQKAGGRIICGIPNCAADPESHGHMCFIIYDLDRLSPK